MNTVYVEVETYLRVMGINVRPSAETFAKLIDNGILYPERSVLAMGNVCIHQGGRYGKGGAMVKMFVPEDFANLFIKGVCIWGIEFSDLEENARGKSGPEASAISRLQRS